MKPLFSRLKNYWNEIPQLVRKFLIRSLIIFSIWKFTYHMLLKPTRVIDVPLTVQTSKNTTQLLALLYPTLNFTTIQSIPANNKDFFGVQILKNSKKILTILDPCNALEVFVLYIAFIISLPSNLKRMSLFVIGGVIGIYILNIIRCTFLGILNMDRSSYIDFAHHYLFTMVVYVAIFIGWALYINQSPATNEI